jgi:chromosome segregation ATPase
MLKFSIELGLDSLVSSGSNHYNSITQLNSKIAVLENGYESKVKELTDLTEQLERLKQHTSGSIQSLDDQLNEQQQQLNTLNELNTRNNSLVKRLNEEILQQKEIALKLQEANRNAHTQLSQAQQQNKGLEELVCGYKAADEKRRFLSGLSVEQFQSELRSMKSEWKELQQANSSLKNKVNNDNSALEAEKARNQQLSKELAEAKSFECELLHGIKQTIDISNRDYHSQ